MLKISDEESKTIYLASKDCEIMKGREAIQNILDRAQNEDLSETVREWGNDFGRIGNLLHISARASSIAEKHEYLRTCNCTTEADQLLAVVNYYREKSICKEDFMHFAELVFEKGVRFALFFFCYGYIY